MDTKTLETLHQLAPDLMDKMLLRALVLERISALAPVGRRALAQRLRMPEREIRSICESLREEGLISTASSGMMITPKAEALLPGARSMTKRRNALSQLEQHIARSLNVGRVCIVPGSAQENAQIFREAGRVIAEQLLRLLSDGMVLTVSGGEIIAAAAQAVSVSAPMNVRVLPARGGSSAAVETQPGTLAAEFARALGGSYSLIHLPDMVPPEVLKELMRLSEISEAVRRLQQTDVLLYGIECAGNVLEKCALSASETEYLRGCGAVGEAAGCCFDAAGRAVYQVSGVGLNSEQMAQVICAAAAMGACRAQAVQAVLRHHRHELLVLDESAARALEKLI